jgi:hypothetical protein
VTNENIIADKFNDYFTNVGSNLAEKIPSVNIDPITYIRGSFPSSLFLQDVERFEVERIIRALKHSSAGYDGIHAKVLKHIYRLIIEPLTHVLHLSISQGFFPNEMKLAKIIPLYKSGDTIHIGNYRPVSVLPIFSKLLERLMYNRVFSFININNILYKYQFGFREKHSTNLALITLIDKIASAIDNGDIFLGVFLDLKKAFDTVNHNILLHKLFKYGIRGIAFNWFQDYLRGRKQFVSFNDAESSRLTIKCGVPQGSILGPLLFLLYINDIKDVSNVVTPIVFADDTSLFIRGGSVEDTFSSLNQELIKIKDWLGANKLSLNLEKTHYIVFRSARSRRVLNDNILKIDNCIIERVEHIKFIGVTVDAKLTWVNHIKSVKSKVAKGIGVLAKARKYVDIMFLKLLYNSIIYSHLNYCVEVWGNSANIHINSLFKLQKKAVRLIKNASFMASTDPIFKSMKSLKLTDIFAVCTLTFVFKFVKGMLPEVFYEFYKRNNRVISRQTRQSNKLYIPIAKSALYEKTIRINGAKYWNNIDDIIDYNCSLHTFKKRLKNHFISKLSS